MCKTGCSETISHLWNAADDTNTESKKKQSGFNCLVFIFKKKKTWCTQWRDHKFFFEGSRSDCINYKFQSQSSSLQVKASPHTKVARRFPYYDISISGFGSREVLIFRTKQNKVCKATYSLVLLGVQDWLAYLLDDFLDEHFTRKKSCWETIIALKSQLLYE